jgi:hypothetical protein
MWLGHDLLETPARLAKVWYLAIDSLCAVGLALPLQSDRLVPRSRGQLLCSSGFWGAQTGPNLTDRAKLGSKRHLICDGRGVPLAIQLTGANRNDPGRQSHSLMLSRLYRVNEDDHAFGQIA